MNERFLFNSLEMFGVEDGSIFGSFLLWLISRYADYTYNMFIERRFAILPGAARQDLQAPVLGNKNWAGVGWGLVENVRVACHPLGRQRHQAL